VKPAADPITLFRLAHARQQHVCDGLDELAASNIPDIALARDLLDHVRTELPLHFADEEEGLFPLLRARARPGDGLAELLDRLAADHEATHMVAEAVEEALSRLVGGDFAGPKCRALLRTHADHERRHLAEENERILPLAERLLGPDDRAELLAQMRRRRAAEKGLS
jgi:hemerythrin-like domain-containing protein